MGVNEKDKEKENERKRKEVEMRQPRAVVGVRSEIPSEEQFLPQALCRI